MKAPIINNQVVIDTDQFSSELVKNEQFIEICGNENIEILILQILATQEDNWRSLASVHKKLNKIEYNSTDKLTEITMIKGNRIAYVIALLMSALLLTQIL